MEAGEWPVEKARGRSILGQCYLKGSKPGKLLSPVTRSRADGSCIRLRPERKDHVWSYDMALIRTTDSRTVRILVIIDEYTWECLSMHVARSIRHQDILDQLYELFLYRA